MFKTLEGHYFPIEWIHPLDTALDVLDDVESALIYHFTPVLNDKKINKNYSKIPGEIIVENHTGITTFLHGSLI
ncbi:hypothetical protein [Bacillus wiedmannii]|uniref:hypothetical protein n=1 Tax=Bacillus wiedmannii TaxID=1890302 RepID=UPI0021CF3F5C|nr:hypothetical protein [Bacillus wiedmannii]MCU5330690.1 hypothetical protein [Bacillus wiedmannii]